MMASKDGDSPLGTPKNLSYTSIVVDDEGSQKSVILESTDSSKLKAADDILRDIRNFLREKKAGSIIDPNIRNKVMALAFAQAKLEGQTDQLREENARLRMELKEVHHPDADLKLRMARLQGQNDELRAENARLRGELASASYPGAAEKIKQLEEDITKLREENTKLKTEKSVLPSYAAIAAAPTISKQKTQLQATIEKAKAKQSTVLFFKSTTNQDTKTVRDEITKSINPRADKIKIKDIRSTPNTVIIETESQDDIVKIKNKAANFTDIKCEEPRKSRPLMAVYNVKDHISDQNFLDEMYDINLSDKITPEEFKQEVTIKFKTGPKSRNYFNNILEVSPRVYHLLAKKERIYIKFECLRIKDFIRVPWCAKCNDLGHSAKKCKREEVCHRCGQKGHDKTNCRGEAIGCMPCHYRKRTCNKAGGPECPTHKQLYTRQVENTDYDLPLNG